MKRKYPPEIREQAIMLAAGQSATTAAEALNIPDRTVRYWSSAAEAQEPGTIARYIRLKQEEALKIGLEHLRSTTTRIWESMETIPVDTAKDLQALTTSYAIAVDKMQVFTGQPTTGLRFGSALDGWTEHDRVTLERIERVTLEPQSSQQEG